LAILYYAKNTSYRLSEKRKIRSWINEVISINKKESGEINIILTNDEYILELNRKFLGRDYYTDIITFDYSSKNMISGELYISVERVKENAKKFENDVQKELKRVIIHGILHLLGYRDQNKEEKVIMREMEEKYLKMSI
jgi:probable rRNA maturation factor